MSHSRPRSSGMVTGADVGVPAGAKTPEAAIRTYATRAYARKYNPV